MSLFVEMNKKIYLGTTCEPFRVRREGINITISSGLACLTGFMGSPSVTDTQPGTKSCTSGDCYDRGLGWVT